jgi:hypothetical protein
MLMSLLHPDFVLGFLPCANGFELLSGTSVDVGAIKDIFTATLTAFTT